MPEWLHVLAMLSLAAGGICAMVVVIDILMGHKQHMWIMNLVWPITALYTGPLALYGYYRLGRLSTHHRVREAESQGKKPPPKIMPRWQSVALAATHCGSGCTFGDICAEWLIFFVPFSLFGMKIFAAWVLDYACAYAFGIVFQFFTIAPMRGLSIGRGLVAAAKADTLSLSSWQIGMYGWMAFAIFVMFGDEIPKTDPVFWFMMQIAMLIGSCTAYPTNWWLLKKGIKEEM